MGTASKRNVSEKSFTVSDPVHGYLWIAAHERIIVDHPVTQRLRNILQTGLAHMVFPEARSSRFVHSLGSMHLASRFLVAIAERSDSGIVHGVLQEIQTIYIDGDSFTFKLKDLDELVTQNDNEIIGGLLARKSSFTDNARRKLLCFVEAGLRLAALFHDLGHLPFSHDLEYALKAYATQNDAKGLNGLKTHLGETPHEAIGHRLAFLVLQSLLDDKPPLIRSIYKLAFDILEAEPDYLSSKPKAGALQWLHTLIDGEVDVDRADYLLRDGRALGFEFAEYDLQRLVLSLRVHKTPDLGYFTTVDEVGLSAVESFFIARARSHQQLVRHHKVAQVAAALREASIAGFGGSDGQRLLEILRGLFDQDAVANAKTVLQEFAELDDSWWFCAVRKIHAGNSHLLRACLELVLSRDRKSLKSVWKRKGEISADDLGRLNAAVDKNLSKLRGPLEALRGKNILVATHKFRPYSLVHAPDGSGNRWSRFLVNTKTGLQPLSKTSPLVAALCRAWSEDVHAHAFWAVGANEQSLTPKEVIDGLDVSEHAST